MSRPDAKSLRRLGVVLAIRAVLAWWRFSWKSFCITNVLHIMRKWMWKQVLNRGSDCFLVIHNDFKKFFIQHFAERNRCNRMHGKIYVRWAASTQPHRLFVFGKVKIAAYGLVCQHHEYGSLIVRQHIQPALPERHFLLPARYPFYFPEI